MNARLNFLATLSLASVLAAVPVIAASHAWSQTARTIKLIVAVPPGGSTDVLARLLAEQIGRMQAPTTVAVENRPGADGIMGPKPWLVPLRMVTPCSLQRLRLSSIHK
jgi:tripartite-type tricarboxylate transporter receptor subunit TctC